jgi:glycosyltransferase involved in cell wall biosynthesis
MRDNLVSVIMPCFNCQNYVGLAIESVLNQTYQFWELLICDDSSDDNSKKFIQEYQLKDLRIKLVSNKYLKGAPGARNSCLDEANGQFIAFLMLMTYGTQKNLLNK